MSAEVWYELCYRAFDNDTVANDFVLFVEGCKTPVPEGYLWTTQQVDYQNYLIDMGCVSSSSDGYTFSKQEYANLSEIKNKARKRWHERLQEQQKKRLVQSLEQVQHTELTHSQRLALVKEFKTGLDTVPLVSGLKGFLKYQLTHKDQIVEWAVSEYVFTQNESVEANVRLIKGVLGMQWVYQDNELSPGVKIDIEDMLLWRMNPILKNSELHDILSYLPGQASTADYRTTSIPRAQQKLSLFDWICTLISQILKIF